jgi:hypothetical protein
MMTGAKTPSGKFTAGGLLAVLLILLAACAPAAAADIPTAGESQERAPAETSPPPASESQDTAAAETNPAPTPVDEMDAALAYAQCIRDNGLPEFPDPIPGRGIMLRRDQGMSFNDPRYLAAQEACQDLRPAGLGGGDIDDEERMEMMLAFSQCMRDNGVPGFPDPAPGSGGRLVMPGGQLPFDPNSSTFQAAVQACQSHIQGGMMGGDRP